MSEKQLIIAISREYGSGGHDIAEKLSEYYQLPLYDNNILTGIAEKMNMDESHLRKYDESTRNVLFSRTVKGFSNAPQDIIAEMQFEFLKEMAKKGDSFIIVGRCAETILKGHPGLLTFFILGDMEDKIQRTARKEVLPYDEAKKMVISRNKKRKSYHKTYSGLQWGDSRNYEICINSSRLGITGTAELICHYIDKRREMMAKQEDAD